MAAALVEILKIMGLITAIVFVACVIFVLAMCTIFIVKETVKAWNGINKKE